MFTQAHENVNEQDHTRVLLGFRLGPFVYRFIFISLYVDTYVHMYVYIYGGPLGDDPLYVRAIFPMLIALYAVTFR